MIGFARKDGTCPCIERRERMQSVQYGDGASVPAFEETTDNPLYWLLRLCHMMVVEREALRSASFNMTQLDTTDVTNAETSVSTFFSNAKGWMDGVYAASDGGGTPPDFSEAMIPDLIQFFGLAATGNWGLVFVLFVKVGMAFLMQKFAKDSDPGTETTDLAQVMKEIFAVLNPSTGEIEGCKLEGLANLTIQVRNILWENEQESVWSANS